MRDNFLHISASLKMMWKLDKAVFISSLFSCAIDAVLPFAGIFLSSYVVDELTGKINIVQILTTVIITVFCIFILTVIKSYLNKVNAVHSEICVRKFDMKMNERTLTMDYELLDSPKVNDIRIRMNNDHSWGSGFYSMIWMLPWLMGSAIGLFASIVILLPLFITGNLFCDPLAIAMLVIFAVILVFSSLFLSKNKKKFNNHLKESDKEKSFYGHFTWGDMDYKTGKDIRIYNMKPLIKSYFDRDAPYNSYVYQAVKMNASGGFVGGLTSGLLLTVSYLFVVIRAVSGALTIGLVLKYAGTIYQFATQLNSVISAYHEYSVAARRQQSTMDYMNIQDVIHKGTLPVEKRVFCDAGDNEYEIAFKKVSFKYPGTENYALKNLNMKLNIGEKLAVVGMNGSGKTTMIKLLCRLYDPTEGEILLNGIDIKKYDYSEYMSIFSVVFQDFKLFSFRLGQNVSASVKYDSDRVVSCLKKAGFTDRLSAMPKGIHTCLYQDFEEDGVEISGGEAQKIALARALYKNAPFIVLDEPTAALDPIAEYEIYATFNEIVGDKTAIYISHRLSSCRFCDDIAVFHEGELIQRGSHTALIADKMGKYYELWNAQAQYYQDNHAKITSENPCRFNFLL